MQLPAGAYTMALLLAQPEMAKYQERFVRQYLQE